MISILYAHPYSLYSRVNQFLLQSVQHWPDVKIANLYEQYPDFYIDIQAEQQRLQQSDVIVLQYPMQWSLPPALMVQYLEKVLQFGWAYGNDDAGATQQLAGKTLWVVANGIMTAEDAVMDMQHLAVLKPLQALAAHCGMQWAAPLLIPHQQKLSDDDLAQLAIHYQHALTELRSRHPHAS